METEIQQATALYNQIMGYLVEYSFQIFGAVIILVIGMFIARKISNLVLALCEKRNMDITLSRFFASCTRIALIGAVMIIVLPKLGIQVTPFVAAIGAVGLGAGLAMQGLLSNYGAGLSIILTRPFVVGDTIKVQGVSGLVEEVHLAYTILSNEDQERITIPNRHIVGEIIHNSQADSMLELSVGIAYDSDPKKAIEVIIQCLSNIDGLSASRVPQAGIDNFGDSSIDLGVRCWAKTERYHEVRFSCTMAIHLALQQHGIAVPFPQREVRLLNSAD
ncbi:MAG: mechanosensitive ion channel protein MscS [SAR86 cluster bacterium]|uniref:Small-conductance mechanosensitive channel n=1 Tax=SAR86 cluster bacterium TaxID=2030880 RepID=A0A2A4ML96_9GAMM|nr:MAG: mechanosensitive ion channel protein MscS [SAR86 cluster bacterium]